MQDIADHDSFMNYAERTNTAISDAMCTGTSINCDIHDALENQTVEDVASMDNRTFKELSFQAQIKNSHHITDQLVQRINEAHSSVSGRWVVGPGRQNDGPVLEHQVTLGLGR